MDFIRRQAGIAKRANVGGVERVTVWHEGETAPLVGRKCGFGLGLKRRDAFAGGFEDFQRADGAPGVIGVDAAGRVGVDALELGAELGGRAGRELLKTVEALGNRAFPAQINLS